MTLLLPVPRARCQWCETSLRLNGNPLTSAWSTWWFDLRYKSVFSEVTLSVWYYNGCCKWHTLSWKHFHIDVTNFMTHISSLSMVRRITFLISICMAFKVHGLLHSLCFNKAKNILWGHPCLPASCGLNHIITTVTLEHCYNNYLGHIVVTMASGCIIATVVLDHIVAAMTLDTIVAFVTPLVARLVPLEFSVLQRVYFLVLFL
jgi:hypothetical protein